MMINTFEITKQEEISGAVARIRRSSIVPRETVEVVQQIIDSVAAGGDDALMELTERLDGVSIEGGQLEIAGDEISRAYDELPEEIRNALVKAEQRITRFAAESLTSDWMFEMSHGLSVGQIQLPMGTVGIYVPGGRSPYPSTVLMAGVPAREAGVKDIVFCIPPDRRGLVNEAVLAAARLVGDCRVFRVGGAQAVAAMAFGTESIPKCAMIAGPGNIYVTTAKRLLSDVVAVDLEAGPSEVAVYVDVSVDVKHAVSDVLAQLEHDPLALAVLVSVSKDVIDASDNELRGLPTADRYDGTANLILCGDGDLALRFINALAPEHLELMVEGAEEVLANIDSAGCVFIGPYSPVVLGDYIAGPSHVLPTGGRAAQLSGLSAQSFRRTMNVIYYTKDGFLGDSDAARVLARLEGLEGHARSIDVRLQE